MKGKSVKLYVSRPKQIFSFEGTNKPLGEGKQFSGNSFYANVLVHCH